MGAEDTLALAIGRIRSLSLPEKLALAETLDSPNEFSRLSLGDAEKIIRRRTRIRVWEPETWLGEARHDQKGLTRGDFKCTFYWDRDFPPLLREIHDPPFLLFYRGRLPRGDSPALAVVGTRYPSGCGLKAAFGFALDVGRRGVAVVSGLARGIDCSAHRGNTAGGGRSVAVLGCGIDRIYPASSVGAAREMLTHGGCIISEYGTGISPLKYHFPERNRIISGLSRAVVVVEAPQRSGALITADFALEQGRDLYIHGSCLEGSRSAGCRRLAFEGAPAVYRGDDILEAWGLPTCSADGESKPDETRGTPANSKPGSIDLLEKEIQGELVSFSGEFFEK